MALRLSGLRKAKNYVPPGLRALCDVRDIGGKNITEIAQHFDKHRLMKINLNLAPQAHDQHINGAIKQFHTFTVRQKLKAARGSARAAHRVKMPAVKGKTGAFAGVMSVARRPVRRNTEINRKGVLA